MRHAREHEVSRGWVQAVVVIAGTELAVALAVLTLAIFDGMLP